MPRLVDLGAPAALALGVSLAGVALGAIAAPGAGPAAAGPSDPVESATCRETFPPGAERPKVTESFPERGQSGYALVLDVTIEHGKGESVLPGGGSSQGTGDESRALEAAGFYLPSSKGPDALRLVTKIDGERARSHMTIPVVALPKKPGRVVQILPPLPIAMARASGEVRTLCTAPHAVTLEDPIANTPDAKPRANPKPVRQLEEWTAAKHAAIGGLAALALGSLVFWLYSLWKRRPKPVPAPPPPRPPWDVALEELFDVRVAQLVEQGRFAEHFDRVSDAVRKYLGSRYGFDGMETTTHEAMSALRKVSPRIAVLTDVDGFLADADLVKFAKLTPTESECHGALGKAEEIVRRTMPMPDAPERIAPPGAPGGPGAATSPPAPAPPPAPPSGTSGPSGEGGAP